MSGYQRIRYSEFVKYISIGRRRIMLSMLNLNYTMRRVAMKFRKKDKFDELKKRWDANEAELVNAFKTLGYGKE